MVFNATFNNISVLSWRSVVNPTTIQLRHDDPVGFLEYKLGAWKLPVYRVLRQLPKCFHSVVSLGPIDK